MIIGLNFSHIEAYPPVVPVPFESLRLWWNSGDSWAELQPASGAPNWLALDNWVTKSAGKDLLYTFGRVPAWAGGGADCKSPPSDVDTTNAIWKAFVTALVTRYKGKIATYELWNEPDIYWRGTPAQLVRMAKDAYALIKSIDPVAQVVGPSPSTANRFGVHFLPDYYAAGGAPFQDIVGCHFYQYDNVGKPVRSANPWVSTSVTQLKALMAANGISDKPIWYTEGGWGMNYAFTPPLTAAEQAAWVTDSYAILRAAGVARVYWYAYDNAMWGTLAAGLALTPAGIAFKNLPPGGRVPTSSTVNISVPASQVTAPAVAVPVPASQVMAPSQIVPVPASQVPITVVDATTPGVTQTWAGNTLTLTDSQEPR